MGSNPMASTTSSASGTTREPLELEELPEVEGESVGGESGIVRLLLSEEGERAVPSSLSCDGDAAGLATAGVKRLWLCEF